MKSIFAQSEYDVRFEWGLAGVEVLAPSSDVLIIVDVLSFSTAVNIATGKGASVFPYRFNEASAQNFAESIDAMLAVPRSALSARTPYSLSPATLTALSPGQRIVLPSPNGSTCCARAVELGVSTLLAGSFVNAAATARAAQERGKRIAVIAAGERWPDGTLRPALEDYLGAGAILAALTDVFGFSPEAWACEMLYTSFDAPLHDVLSSCVSGQELVSLGFADDVRIAATLNMNDTASLCTDGHFIAGI